ncbi:DUF4328 domain-containing protein [Nannocystaceae bacterium ST9]
MVAFMVLVVCAVEGCLLGVSHGAFERLITLSGVAFSLAMKLGAGILWMVWASAALRNARAFGVDTKLRSTDLIVWWFVPALNWVMPYLALKALWKASAGGDARGPIPVMLGIWWAAWVAHQEILLLSPELFGAWLGIDEPQLVWTIRSVALLVAGPACVLVILRITADQSRARRRWLANRPNQLISASARSATGPVDDCVEGRVDLRPSCSS